MVLPCCRLVMGLLVFQGYPGLASSESQDVGAPSVFRPGHNLTFLTLFEQTDWRVRNTENVSGFKVQHVVPAVSLRYSFHINWAGTSGFALGTAVAAFFAQDPVFRGGRGADGPGVFRASEWFQFPSLSAGLVQNVGSRWRFALWGEYAALFLPSVRVSRRPSVAASQDGASSERQVKLSLIPDSVAASLQSDFFLNPFWGITLWTGYRSMMSSCLGGCSTSAFANTFRFETEGWQLGAGVTWQAGAFFDE